MSERESLCDARLREIRERAERATAGPWYFDGRDILTRQERDEAPMRYLVIPLPETWHESQAVNRADADFIAGAREDLPWLLAHVDQLREENDRLREALEDISSGQWQRYPTRERHGCVTVAEYARFEAAGGRRGH